MVERVLTGVPAAPGLAEGPAVLRREEAVRVPRRADAAPDVERRRLAAARAAARAEIEELRKRVAVTAGGAEAAIFAAHLMFLDDDALLSMTGASVAQGTNAEAAWVDAVEHFAGQLEHLADPTFRARAADVRDVGRRVLAHLSGRPAAALELPTPAVVVAQDLAPSEVASLDRARVLALCLAHGGPTSHAAILARAWGVPAVAGLGEAVMDLNDGDRLLVDGGRGEVIVSPGDTQRRAFHERAGRAARREQAELAASGEAAVMRDGRRVKIEANVGSVEEAVEAVRAGAEGIGLLRTEFLFLNRREAPGEDEQTTAYLAVLEVMGPRPVVLRTLDAGGDKPLQYLPVQAEANPFLGYRAIRVLLDHPDLLKAQLRAMLRAGPGRDLRIMFPMVATLDELRRARALFDEVRRGLQGAGPEAGRVQVGMTVEVPAAVVLADHFAREVDFLSIGTNDLAQYTMAADRGNEMVARLHDGCHPAVLRQVHRVIEAGHAAGIWIGVCGELAGDQDAVPVLVGLGIDELSMTPASIPKVKAIVRRRTYAEAQRLAAEAIDLDSAEAVRALVHVRSGGDE